MEDHDRGRCRPTYEQAALDDLQWLGFEPDVGHPADLRAGPSGYRQSNRGQVYAAALERLASGSLVYACDCSRKDILADAEGAAGEQRYPGRCRSRELEPGPGRGIRVVLDQGEERFIDGLLGEQRQEPALQCGDLLLRDRLGNWTYQFCVAVDDMEQDIDLVIRGEDLLASTGRQIRLARMLGRSRPPTYLHHPLIRHPTGAKLSKANRDTAIRDLRARGVPPPAVLGQAASLVGLLESAVDLHVEELVQLFQHWSDAKLRGRC